MPLDGSQSLGAQGHHRAWLSLRSPGATARHPAGLLGSSHVPFLCPLPPEVAPIHPCLLSQDSLLSARPVHPLFSLLPPLPASDGWRMAGQSLSRALASAPPRARSLTRVLRGALRARPRPRCPLALHGLLLVHTHGSLLARALVLLSKSGIYLFFGFLSTASAEPGPGDEGAACIQSVHGWGDKTFSCVS